MQQFTFIAVVTAALLGLAMADMEKRQINIGGNSNSCPGVQHIASSSTICCVGGDLSIPPVVLSTCAGWPICTGPVTTTTSSAPANPPLTCAAVLNMNDPSYSSLLASATSSLSASGTNPITTINPTGAAATPGSSASSAGSAASSRASSAASSAATSATSATANAAYQGSISGTGIGAVLFAWLAGVAAVAL